MRKLIILFVLAFVYSNAMAADPGGVWIMGSSTPSVGMGPDISVDYVKQARKYRDEGRYELARQAYAQAISTCRSNKNLEIIKREMDGVELLIRTMR